MSAPILLWLTLTGCGGAPEGPTGTLLLVSERSGSPEVWAIEADGSTPRSVARGPGATFPAAPDPLGTHALVVSAEDGEDFGHRESLWLVPLDGGERVRLTPDAGRIRNPSWAPDGRWIAFESDGESYRDIYRVQRDGTGLKRLTAAEHGSFEPAISPDGARILVGSSRDGNAEIYAMGADGSDPTRLTFRDANDTAPGWSPDGRSISWISDVEGMPRVWLMGADGADARPLRPMGGAPEVDLGYAWSPDGTRLAVTVQSGPRQIDVQVLDVLTGERLVTLGGPGVDEHPAWSPDGRWIAFASNRTGDTELYLTSADGTSVQRLTESPGPDWLPRWLPASR